MFHSSFSSSSSSTIIPATLLCLLAASVNISLVAAAENNVTVEQVYAKINPTAAAPGFNVEGGSVFTNYVDMVNNGQLFFFYDAGSFVSEVPESDPVLISAFYWCSDLTYSDDSNSSLIGYAGRCVTRLLAYGGAQLVSEYSEADFVRTVGMSAVFVEQLNVFEGQLHADTDDWVVRYWDDGRKTMPWISWKGHDEGDMSPSAATSSWSFFAEVTWMSADEVAQMFNTSVDEFTPEKFKQVYLNTWIKGHEFEAATDNPNADAELAIIEQVKYETNYVDETATSTPAQPDSTAMKDGGSDAANPAVEDDSGSGRQLASVAARFVSAALRVFGI